MIEKNQGAADAGNHPKGIGKSASHGPPVEIPDPVLEAIPSEHFSSNLRDGVMPGSVRAGQALSSVVDVEASESQAAVRESVPSTSSEAATGLVELSVAASGPGCENGALGSEIEGGNTYDHLSGSALSWAFSKALMQSGLPAAEKVRMLTEVTSETDRGAKDQLRRHWLSRLKQ